MFTKMKKIEEKIEIPEGIEVKLDKSILHIKSDKGEVSRDFFSPIMNIIKKDNFLILSSQITSKKGLRVLNTNVSHIKNILLGVKENFTYKVKICSGHFPMTVKKEGNIITISNFLGEKIPRKSKILDNVEVEINGDTITVQSPDIEKAGQTATNLEHATKIKKRDKRIFQDGCYIIKKPKQK